MRQVRQGAATQEPQRIKVIQPTRGLHNAQPDILIDPKEASDLMNVWISDASTIQKRPGFVKLTGLTGNPNGLGSYVDVENDIRRLITLDTGDGNLKYYNFSTSSYVNITGATFDTTGEMVFTQARNKLYAWNGIDVGTQYNGTSLSRPGTMPKAAFGVYYNGLHIVAGVPGQVNRLYISSPSDASDFTNADPPIDPNNPDLSTSDGVPGATVFAGDDANAIDVRKDDGDMITGLGVFQDILIIFKENSIFQMEFNDQGLPVVRLVSSTYGCISHKSIDNVENDLVFVGHDAIYVLGNEKDYFAVIRTNELSSRIRPTMENIDEGSKEKINACYAGNRYYLGVPFSGSVSNVIVYDRRFFAFVLWDTIHPNYITEFTNENGDRRIYFAQDDDTFIGYLTPGTYSDGGEAISAHWTSKAFDAREIDIIKYWRSNRLVLEKETGTPQIAVIFDDEETLLDTPIAASDIGGIGGDAYGEGILGMSDASTITEAMVIEGGEAGNSTSGIQDVSHDLFSIDYGRYARTYKFRIQNDEPGENFGLMAFILSFYMHEDYLFDSDFRIRQ